ncbi:Cadherin-23 [Mactra antiquata]
MNIYILAILVWVCSSTATSFRCDPNDLHLVSSPCDCPSALSFIEVKDTIDKGTVIAEINSTTNFTFTETCRYAKIVNNEVILNVSLRNPCYTGSTECYISCDSTRNVRVVLEVKKIDEYPPQFGQSKYNISISEDLKPITGILDFNSPDYKPTDDDCDLHSFNYALVKGQDGGGKFNFSGSILNIANEIDYEVVNVYNLTVQVKTNNKTGTTVLEVFVTDADDNDPEFTHPIGYVLQFEEEKTVQSIPTIPEIRCEDLDRGINESVLYSFKDYTNSTNFLTINPNDGTFNVDQSLDRETQNVTYTFELWCYQQDKYYKKAITSLQIDILDINDNPAIFEPVTYDVTLVENAVGYVTTVIATDADLGDNAVVLYEMVNGSQSDILAVDENSGRVTIVPSARLDREINPIITAHIIAKDNYGNYSTNTATVVITLLDINDNTPQFTTPYYLFNLNDSYNTGLIGQVEAHDKDEQDTPNSNVTYSFYQNTPSLPFNLNSLTGEIETAVIVNSSDHFNLTVLACDNPVHESDRRCGIADVKIVYGMNFTFTSHEMHIKVSENIPKDTRIGQTLPITGDMYFSSTSDFDVDVSSSLLITKIPFDRESEDLYDVMISVWEYNTPIGNISIIINITDVNDNAPLFSQDEYFITLPHGVGQQERIGILNATDEDIGRNGDLTFTFYSTFSNYFTINSRTGEVLTSNQWEDKIGNYLQLYQLISEVEDNGEPKLNTRTITYISAMVIISDTVLGIPTNLRRSFVMDQPNRTSLETKIADTLGFEDVHINGMEENGILMYINATLNGTVVSSQDIQRSMVENWSSIQDMYREFMAAREYSLDNSILSPAEIALITVAIALMFGTIIAIIVICRQWKEHVKNHKLYDSLSRRSTMYDSQEIGMDFGDEHSSRLNTSTNRLRRNAQEETLEGSFGMGIVNSGFVDYENLPKTPTWSTGNTPRIPRWSTTDSIKDAMESLDELTSRLNSEDNISRVSNLSRSRRSLKSNVSESRSDKIPNGMRQSTPRTDDNTSHDPIKYSAGNETCDDVFKNENYGFDNSQIDDAMALRNDNDMNVSDTVRVITGDDTIEEEFTAF